MRWKARRNTVSGITNNPDMTTGALRTLLVWDKVPVQPGSDNLWPRKVLVPNGTADAALFFLNRDYQNRFEILVDHVWNYQQMSGGSFGDDEVLITPTWPPVTKAFERIVEFPNGGRVVRYENVQIFPRNAALVWLTLHTGTGTVRLERSIRILWSDE